MAPIKHEQGQPKPGPSRTKRSRDNLIPIRAPSVASNANGSDESTIGPTVTTTGAGPRVHSSTAAQDISHATEALNTATHPSSGGIATASTPSPATMRNDPDHDVEMTGEPRATSEDAMEALGGKSRQLIQVIRKLANLNIDATLPSLPKIVVVGDQSAGKSSLVEGICDITLPRDQGTCTRVPIQITTTASNSGEPRWRAEVHLLFSFSYRPKEKGTYNKWVEIGKTEAFHFATIFDKTDLDVTLRRAQLALLNPHQDPGSFVNLDVAKIPGHAFKIGFSPNVISLEIAAPNLPELSFFDLPGAINDTPNAEDRYLIKFVEKLLNVYMDDKKALILFACPAHQDMELSTANRYLRECKAERRATGVLTKPDLMENNSFRVGTVKKMFEGSLYPLGHGWFMAKQLSQDAIQDGVEHEQARELEHQFFNSSPWCDKLGAYADRFGIHNLRTALSQKLTQHILNDLPEIVGRVEARLAEVREKLAGFPEPSADPVIAVIQELQKLKENVCSELSAESDGGKFRTQHRAMLRAMRDEFQAARPTVDLNTPGYQSPVVTLDSSEEEEDEESPTKRAKTNAGTAATPNRQRTPAAHTPALRTPNSQRQRKTPVAQLAQTPTPAEFKLDQVKAQYDSASGADITGGKSTVVTGKLCVQALSPFRAIADTILSRVEAAFREMLGSALQKSLGSRPQTLLYQSASETLLGLFTELMARQRQSFHHRITMESRRAISLDTSIVSKEACHSGTLIAERREIRTKEQLQILESRQNKTLTTPENIKKRTAEAGWLEDQVGHDPYHREVEALGRPFAFYEIVSTQLLDTLARQLDYELLYAYEQQLHPRLLQDLNATDKAHCTALLAEDRKREAERADLEVEKGKLEMALVELRGLPDVHG
ncbi:unnamed protein product [Zymoseptoria tritici ST99CH_1A5]|uniref:GED domain-containing protein n=1 Tax=Zymoseptoria tritici ST99CH_1A5 TaxID=1276529 RepID=A0A1Y6L8S4_ZYMTR|nr:unnamed protein product [Zymoseptoria tritici ST99CH_1A5]